MDARVPHELLRQIMALPRMFVGNTDNLVEAIWVFLSGFEAGYSYQNDTEEGLLFPRELVRYIQDELGLQWNDLGVVPAILQMNSGPDEAFEHLRDLMGNYYGCSMDLEGWREWKAQNCDL